MKKQLLILVLSIVLANCNDKQHHIAEHGDAEKIAVSKKTKTGLLPLHQAIVEGDEVKVIRLIENGADVNQLDALMGNSPLHIACEQDNAKIVEILLQNGAFVNLITPRSGFTPLMVAVWHNQPGNVKALLKQEDINIYIKSPTGGSTVRDIVGGWHKNPNENDAKRYQELSDILDAYETALEKKVAEQKIFQAIVDRNLTESEREKKVKALIASGEPVNTESYVMGKGYPRHSPLLLAARDNKIGIVKLLLDAGADIGQKGYQMNAIAFHKSAYSGNTEIVKLLLSHKDAQKYINDQGPNNGYTPLHDAIWHGHTEAAKLLIEAGARLDLTAYDGFTSLEFAKRYQYNDIVALIEKRVNN
ncbi:ankyrin repeat domain-containing protein [Flagellimonas sp. CMM7]|uniref:ankyrin repeat domain-containing protein n=1 Tax=Flagellimonas sp. CMM7 TaxID=2654676 RepID=UPI0013D0A380|nr:ankyrin repeat domain-containing protein [Flagellimonas sp. CMM7]UII80339.1 ankyrin repeat domain-containing protein [Flagellimonas sp. CMM7]